MWPRGPRPPLAPIPVPPHLQAQQQAQQHAQQQAFLAQQHTLAAHQQAAALPAPDGTGQWVAPGYYNPVAGLPSWDPTALASAFSTTSLTPPTSNEWYFDSGATSHMTSQSSLSHVLLPRYPTPSSIVVGNGSLLPVTATGSTELSRNLRLNNVLVSPQIIKNLISVRQFTTDNNCSVEFDLAGCSVKVLPSRTEIVWCNSSGPLYPLRLPLAQSLVAQASRCGIGVLATPVMRRCRSLRLVSPVIFRIAQSYVMLVS